MNKFVKIALILGGAGMGLLTVAVGAGYFWWQSNEEELLVLGEKAKADAQSFASQANQDACVDEALRRTDVCSSMQCEIQTAIFVNTCLAEAKPVSGFCDVMPPRTEIMTRAQWTLDRCSDLGRDGDHPCRRVMNNIQKHCFGEG